MVECGTIYIMNPSRWRDTQRIVCLCLCAVAHSKHTIHIDGFWDGRYELKILNEIGSIQNYFISKILDTKLFISKSHWKDSIQKIISIHLMVVWFSHSPWDVLIMHHARALSWILFLKDILANSTWDHIIFFSGTHDLVMRLDVLILTIYIQSPDYKIIDTLAALVSWICLFMDVYQHALVVTCMLLCKMINYVVLLCGGCGSMNYWSYNLCCLNRCKLCEVQPQKWFIPNIRK
jgi:hypothetical protein